MKFGYIILGILLICLISMPVSATYQVASCNSMTSNSTSSSCPAGFTANRSTIYSSSTEAYVAFDGASTAPGWQTPDGTTTGWVGQYNPTKKKVTYYNITSASTNINTPNTWTLKGSNTSYTADLSIVDSRSGITTWTYPTANAYVVSNPGFYNYYVLDVTSVNAGGGNQVVVYELILYDNVTAPVAAFTPNATSGTAPLVVAFTDTSTNTPTSWSWKASNLTFPSGFEFSTSQNPTQSFPAGNHTINLTATNVAGSNSTQITWINITAGNSIAADFTASNTSGIQPLLVQFTDTSTNVSAKIDSWNWSFGNGIVSSLQSPPDQTYTNGSYSANLTITNTSYSLVSTKLVTITVYKLPVADFESFNNAGTATFTTYFYDTSYNLNPGPYTYYWDMGDGNTSTEQAFYYNYNLTGKFDVKHSITDSITTVWKNATEAINVGTPTPPVVEPVASYYGGPQLGNPPLKVFFTDVSSNTPTSWFWEFGDGTNSTSQNPEHYFNRSGFYTVNLTVANTAGSNMTTQKNFVMVY